MKIAKLITEVPAMQPGDKVVAATALRDFVIIVTAMGAVYRLQTESHD